MKQLFQGLNARRASQELPQQEFSCRSQCDEAKTTLAKKQLRFSEHSQLRIYHLDRSYEAKKSYSSFNRKVMKEAALLEACRINDLVASVPVRQNQAIQYLLQKSLLTREELLGIEHMIGNKSVTKAAKERQVYVPLVLGVQEYLLEKKYDTIDVENYLARAAIEKSAGSVQRALLRAALAVETKTRRT